jgi:hypothetical protein
MKHAVELSSGFLKIDSGVQKLLGEIHIYLSEGSPE